MMGPRADKSPVTPKFWSELGPELQATMQSTLPPEVIRVGLSGRPIPSDLDLVVSRVPPLPDYVRIRQLVYKETGVLVEPVPARGDPAVTPRLGR